MLFNTTTLRPRIAKLDRYKVRYERDFNPAALRSRKSKSMEQNKAKRLGR